MNRNLLINLLFLSSITIKAQDTYHTYPQNIAIGSDSIAIRWSNGGVNKYELKDKHNFNNDAVPGAYLVLYFENDSIRIDYENKIPYGQYTYINFIQNGNRKTIRLGFDMQPSVFSKSYVSKNTGNVQFEIPEVYELANIIWTLSPNGKRASDLNKDGYYYKKVIKYFKPFLNHSIFQKLNFDDSNYFRNYYDFRENSFAFQFGEKGSTKSQYELLYSGPYYYVYGDEFADSSLFGKLKPLVEDFAQKSKFRQFYKHNLKFYEKQIKREKKLLPIIQMWRWLENQFPEIKYQSYKIVFSPLIGGSHSTQRYSTSIDETRFRENVMFICNTEKLDRIDTLNETQREALMSGIVFTEIDHNYVNPSSNKYRKEIDTIFQKRNIWVKESQSTRSYPNSISIFNEYMTWSLFCLYLLDHYDAETAHLVINEREVRMVEKRNFIKFKEFNRTLIGFKTQNSNLKAIDLYPLILNWCKNEH